jgi:hypothetical protein
MSNKRQVPTFRVQVVDGGEWMEGPLVAPDRSDVAQNLSTVQRLLQAHGGVLIYAGEWVLLPLHSIRQVRRGRRMFLLPWPLEDTGTVTEPEADA